MDEKPCSARKVIMLSSPFSFTHVANPRAVEGTDVPSCANVLVTAVLTTDNQFVQE